MKILRTADEMRAACRNAKSAERRLGFVPTMGALHAGHLSLVRAARAQCAVTTVSIFVNPTQFSPSEDFSRYPRDFNRDVELLQAENVDFVFAPETSEMYPPGAETWVEVEGLSNKLCGRSRPGHFRGVTTIVSKLFHVIEPDCAYFGQKDAAQVAVIKRMVRDLDLAVEVVVCPIVREADGLALSSRNAYLTPEQRKQALALYRALMRIEFLADSGERSPAKLIEAGKNVIAEEPALRLDYLEIVDPESLEPLSDLHPGALVAIAAFIGSTRLIDNIVLHASGKPRVKP